MKIRATFFLVLMLPQLLLGSIIETAQFDEVLKHVGQDDPKNVLVLCDIDNTLLRSAHHLGSAAWGDHIISRLVSKGMSKREAEEIENIFWKTVQPRIKVTAVDSKTPSIIHEIQKRKIPVLGLTARTPEEAGHTVDQLMSIDINLLNSGYPFFAKTLNIEGRDALYEKGILFTTPFIKKSEVLFTYLEKHAIAPKRIIFVDDKMSHVEDLASACNERGIAYVGIRFSAADNEAKNFDARLADIQWEAFPVVLSNEQAENIYLSLKRDKYAPIDQ